MDGEASPPGPDLEELVLRREVELLTDQVELVPRPLFETAAGLREDRAGVGHRAVQEGREEVVAEIVVRRDVTATLGPAVGAQAKTGEMPHPGHPAGPSVELVRGVTVARHDPDQGGQVVCAERA